MALQAWVVCSMKLIVYPLLNTRSKRAMGRYKKRFGRYYVYHPRQVLINRLCRELNMSEKEVRQQIRKERRFIIKNERYFKNRTVII